MSPVLTTISSFSKERLVYTPRQGNVILPATRRIFFVVFRRFSAIKSFTNSPGFQIRPRQIHRRDFYKCYRHYELWKCPCVILTKGLQLGLNALQWLCVREHRRYAVSSLLNITLGGARTPLVSRRSVALLIGWRLFIVLIEDELPLVSFCETSLTFSEARGYKNISVRACWSW